MNPADLDPGIRGTVLWLRAHNYETTDSGDGSKAETMECALDRPNVAMVVAPGEMVAEADRLARLLASRGVELVHDFEGPTLEASYQPGHSDALLLLLCVDDEALGLAETE